MLETLSKWLDGAGGSVAAAAIGLSLVQLVHFVLRSRKDIAVSYRISVIGLPRSGKTALISAIFDHIFHSTSGQAFAPVGEKTIDKINNQIMLLDSRQTFNATKDDDIFIFRFLYYVRRVFLLARIRYEGEVVDFPGEMSAALVRSAEDGSIRDDVALFHKEFYSWILSSKVHIFVIDLARFFLADDRHAFAAARAAEIRKTWQVLNEEIHRAQRSEERRIGLVFSKADLSRYVSEENGTPLLERMSLDKFRQYGYEQAPVMVDTEPVHPISPDDFHRYVRNQFRSLEDFFRGQRCEFNIFFTSAYRAEGGERIGIPELVRFILPKASY